MMPIVILVTCQKCGATIIYGTKYCKHCAIKENDFSGYTSIDLSPLWVWYIIFGTIIGLSLWAIYLVITH